MTEAVPGAGNEESHGVAKAKDCGIKRRKYDYIYKGLPASSVYPKGVDESERGMGISDGRPKRRGKGEMVRGIEAKP